MAEAILLADFIRGEMSIDVFNTRFAGRQSANFNPVKDLERIGVVNQTTMLASDTQGIADYLRLVMVEKYDLNESNVEERFAETRDTLCYATNDNQSAAYGLLEQPGDLAIILGGYNSSNTSHLVELCEEKLPTYFINSSDKILTSNSIMHYDLHAHQEKITENFLPQKDVLRILITSGASCPDALVEQLVRKLAAFYGQEERLDDIIKDFTAL